MPKLDSGMTSQMITGTNFTFQGAQIEDLGATEYTLVTIAVDVTGSVYNFKDDLRTMLIAAVESCQRSPRSDNLMVRVVQFSTSVGVDEIHGFKLLSDIDTSSYPHFSPGGGTPLTDTVDSAIGAMADYGQHLFDNDFLANGIVFIITDGDDNASTTTPAMVQRRLARIRRDEQLESIVSILIGINDAQLAPLLATYRADCGLDQYIAAGDATKGKLAKLAAFVSQSISSQSQALGTGGPSQQISLTI